MLSGFSSLNQHASTFWSVTLQPLSADQATIPHMKGDYIIFHMTPNTLIVNSEISHFHMFLLIHIAPYQPENIGVLVAGGGRGRSVGAPPRHREVQHVGGGAAAAAEEKKL